ncbi:CDP-glycerol:poly(glycerophosphate) glycerophosphotransferase [Cellulomonas sp. PhB143]|nr:CDP-glycerol:poly(glycerophosphate) glycerophosphotransferase [Cellulomonas sp. PhB143]
MVPAYNAEAFVRACLHSILNQTERSLEIVVVDDGSSDSTGSVVRAVEESDKRVRYVRQRNGGLGNARNRGLALARGKHVMFVDSDDTIPRNAVESLLSSVRATGSDFACGAMQRVENGKKLTAAWVAELHAVDDLGVTIADRPDMILDVFATNKLYTREFLSRINFSFPEGIYYEDQVPSVNAYLNARRFDVLSTSVYNWTIRTDGGSITQTTAELRNLKDRESVTCAVNEMLKAHGNPALRREWLDRRILGNDLALYVKDVDWVEDEYYAVIVRWLTAIFDERDWSFHYRTSPIKRAIAWTCVHGDREDVELLREFERKNGGGVATSVESGTVVVRAPELRQVGRPIPADVLTFGEAALRLTSSLRGVSWEGTDLLVLRAWAFIANIDLAEHETRIEILVKDPGGVVLASAEGRHDAGVRPMQHIRNRWLDYDPAGFVARLDLSGLRAAMGGVWLRVTTAGIVREAPLERPRANGAAKLPLASPPESLRRNRLEWVDGTLTVLPEVIGVMLEDVRVVDDDVELTLCSEHEDITVVAIHDGNRRRHTAKASAVVGRENLHRAVLRGAASDLAAHRTWRLRAKAGKYQAIAVPAGFPDRRVLAPGVGVRRTDRGNVAITRGGATLVVTEHRFDDGEWALRGEGAVEGLSNVRLTGSRVDVSASSVRIDPGGSFEMRFPLSFREWSGSERRLPPGLYELVCEYAGGQPVCTVWGNACWGSLPALNQGGDLWVRSTRERRPVLEVLADTGGVNSALSQRTLQETVYEPARHAAREEAVLFESFHGRNVTCNPHAIWQRLRVVRPDITSYWSVNDSSVEVPEGTVPLVRLSAEWYRVLGSARYLVNNSNFPAFFEQADEQKYLQTWHGTPLKLIGHDIKRVLFSYRNYLEMMDREARSWDGLISPNRFCSGIFPRAFAYEGSVLESGYPRNDVLVNDPGGAAAKARRLLGLVDDPRKLLLYAPTWRDDKYDGKPGRYQSVYHLDFEKFAAELGDEYVVLVRGHSNTLLHGTGVSGENVVDVSRYGEVAELYAAADVLVTDFSSVMFDYTVTRRPVMFLAPDIDDYRDRVRGFYFDFEAEAPGPILRSTEELVDALRSLDGVAAEFSARYEAWTERFNALEDGKASDRVIDGFF